MCEAFSCTPSAADRELERDPQGVFEILQMRAYAEIYRGFAVADTADKQPQGTLADWYRQIVYRLAVERNPSLAEGKK